MVTRFRGANCDRICPLASGGQRQDKVSTCCCQVQLCPQVNALCMNGQPEVPAGCQGENGSGIESRWVRASMCEDNAWRQDRVKTFLVARGRQFLLEKFDSVTLFSLIGTGTTPFSPLYFRAKFSTCLLRLTDAIVFGSWFQEHRNLLEKSAWDCHPVFP